MNGRERISRIMTGQPLDRPPVVPVLSLYGSRLTLQDSSDYYTDPKAYAAGQAAVMGLFNPDVLFSPFSLTVEGAAFGGEEKFLNRYPPNMKRFAIQNASEAERLKAPDVSRHPRLLYVRESMRLMKAEQGDKAMLCGICLSPVCSPALIMGMESWLDALLFDPKGTKTVLGITVPFFVEWANALIADGADFIALPLAFCNPEIITEEMAQNTVLPVLRDAFAQVRGGIVFHHVGARIQPFLHLLTDLPQVIGFALDSRDDLKEARAIVGPGKLLLGGVDGPTLAKYSAEEAESVAVKALEAVANDPLVFLATAAADIPWETPPANILSLFSAAEKVGGKKLPESHFSEVVLCACSIFRASIERMDWDGAPPERFLYLDSSLHMNPSELDSLLGSVVAWELSQGRRVLVAYGDCSANMVDRCNQPGVRRIEGMNCCEAILGHDRNHQILKEKAFVFLPEWTSRWHEMLKKAFGLDGDALRDVFAEYSDKIIFVEPEGRGVPPEKISEIETFFKLPCAHEKAGGAVFEANVRSSLKALREKAV